VSAELAAGLTRAGGIVGAVVRDGGVPGGVAAVGRGPVTLSRWVAGWADTTPVTARPMTAGTLFDLASLTKVVGTTTTVLALAGRGLLGLDDPAARYLPGFTALRNGAVTIRHLLAHTSGLPDTRKFYQCCSTRDELLRDLFATPLQAPPGTRVTYSDLGFLALGEIVAAVAGGPLDAAVRTLVTGPLGMTGTSYAPAAEPGRFAATERREDGTPISGVVHDENARLMGGVAGHAGLFTVAADLAAFCAWWVSAADLAVPATLRREAESGQTVGLGGSRGLGWVRGGDRFDILGGHWPASAVSHTGFTGTSLALDSPSGVWTVLLTNSVHFGREAAAVKILRRDFHAAVAAACFRSRDGSHDGDPEHARTGLAAAGTEVTPGGSSAWTA
jgi:CubicO group peptidase (beta-lactamase class C family)